MIDEAPSRDAAGHRPGSHVADGARRDAADSVRRRLAELESLLSEKDQLVTALTVQLEEAAERLDRVQRSGADRGPRVIGGLPREFVEQQQQLADDLQRAMQQWEDFHAAAALGRIEMQIGELRDLVSSRLTDAASRPVDEHEPAEPDAAVESPQAEGPSAWQALKESLLQSDSPQDSASRAAPAGSDLDADVSEAEAAAPEGIDIEEAPREALAAAVEQRDAYIAWLIRRVRSAELKSARGVAPADAPEAVRQRLAELEHAFQQQQRMLEVELSLERARVGREEARVHQLEAQLQKDTKRLGMHGPDGRPGGNAAHDAPEAGKSRWRRMLGMGADE